MIILGCLIPVWYISKSCIGACALMQKQGTPRICWISPVGSSVIWVCFNKKLRWELATHLWEELQVHPSHLLSCDRSCDLMCTKKGSVSKGLEATSMSYAAVVGCLGWFLPLNRWNNLSKAVDQRVKLISPKAFAHGAARRWQQVLELQAWIWKVWVWVKS